MFQKFDRFTEQTNASLAKVFWLSKVTKGKAGSVIVSKMKECLPSLIHEFKSSKGLEIPANTCDVTVFADFLLNTQGIWLHQWRRKHSISHKD